MVAINTATATSVPIASPAALGHGTGPRGGRNTVASVPCRFIPIWRSRDVTAGV